MKPWLKITIGIISTFVVLLIAFTTISYFILNKTLPDYNGNFEVSGINNKVEIFRDKYAIPYVYSSDEEDLYFALGYLHAQERLFQMDLTRRAGEGRLSEVLGKNTIKFDKLFRTLGLYKLVKENYEQYDETTKKVLVAYSGGVNEFISKQNDKFTIEFDVLGYKPYDWKPEHSLLIAKLMAWELNISWWTDIAFTNLIQKLGREKAEEILPTFDENGPRIIPSKIEAYSEITTILIELDKEFRKIIGAGGTHIGSNNWVVNGSRSESGKSIIANDPHLSFAAPGKWYFAALRSPEISFEGFTLPGVPGVVIGKNEKISWVLTNVMADDADFYVEKLDSNKSNYFFDGEWKSLEVSEDTIHVKDSADVIFTIRKNHRGPIISNVHKFEEKENSADISMRWTALDFTNELSAFYKINHAKNWEEFDEALELFIAPGQNFVYADTENNIGYIAGVRLPIRKNNGPSFIFDGTTSESDWTGSVPFSKNPKLYNPKNGFIASANNKTIEDYPYHISNLWEPKSRITRIVELLNSKEKHSVEDFKKYQNDFFSHYAKDIVPYIINAFSNYDINNRNLEVALNIISQWDYIFKAESQVPAIYSVFYNFLLKNIFEDELGEDQFNEYVFIANVPYRVVPKLLSENKSSWFDNVSTDEIENRDFIIRKSLIEALEYLEIEHGEKIEYWQWGKLHKVKFKHFFHGQSDLLDNIFDIGPFEIGGDGTTVFNTEYYFTDPYLNQLGPSMRYIFDFNQPDQINMILPTGQSGNFFSDHYDDMTEMWLNGDYITIHLNADSIKKSNNNLMQLIPIQ